MTPNGVRITVFTWVKDEEHILPFFLRHYRFADEIIVWDNMSRDMSREILGRDGRVVVHDWDTGGELRDDQLTAMKGEAYRNTGPGWKIVVDADEFLFHPNIPVLLDACDTSGITVPQVRGFDMVSNWLPADDGGSLLTGLIKEGVPNPAYNKVCVFRHDCDVRYEPGAHSLASFGGRFIPSSDVLVRLLHYRFLTKELVMEKARRIRLSKENINSGTGIAQASPEEMGRAWESAWKRRACVI